MRRKRVVPGATGTRMIAALAVAVFALTCGGSNRPALAANLISNFDTTLQPGVWHGFVIGPSSAAAGYVAEITPVVPGVDGETIERYVIQPEFDGAQWNDVLRIRLSALYAALPVNVRIYDTSGLPVAADFTATLQPGVWHGFSLGPSSQVRGFIAEITPLGAGTNGQTIERYAVQPEYDGARWNDVFRAQVAAAHPQLDVHVRIYGTDGLTLAADFPTILHPGVWHGFHVAPSIDPGAYVAEISPSDPGTDGETIERYVLQPEFNGIQWNDVLRSVIAPIYPPLAVNVRLYRLYAPPTAGRPSTWGRVKALYR